MIMVWRKQHILCHIRRLKKSDGYETVSSDGDKGCLACRIGCACAPLTSVEFPFGARAHPISLLIEEYNVGLFV
jgi:hypothetical protein